MTISALIDYFRSNYKETNEEKNEKKTLVRYQHFLIFKNKNYYKQLQQRLIDAQRRVQSDLLFEKLNTTCTGVIKLEPLANFLKQYKEGAAIEQIEQGKFLKYLYSLKFSPI